MPSLPRCACLQTKGFKQFVVIQPPEAPGPGPGTAVLLVAGAGPAAAAACAARQRQGGGTGECMLSGMSASVHYSHS